MENHLLPPKSLKTEPHKPSQFERIQMKCIDSEKKDQDSKKMKVEPTQKLNPVQSTQIIPSLLEAPQYLSHLPPMIHQYIEKNLGC